MKLLMCRPTFFDIIYNINPWMTDQFHQVNHIMANFQWDILVKTLLNHCEIKFVEPVDDLPDMIFTANAGFVYDNKVILSRFKNFQRSPESDHFARWFESNGYKIITSEYVYEGAGDHLIDSQNRHWLGSGFRTDPQAINQIKQLIDAEFLSLNLVDPRFYHLDTCFCPLPGNAVMWFPAAFNQPSQKLIRSKFDLSIEVSELQALDFCCNSIVKDNFIFMPCSNIDSRLDSLGFEVYTFDLCEFMKSGGAARCLALDI